MLFVIRYYRSITMTLSVRLSIKDENLLEKLAQHLGRNKSDLVRQAVQELCQRMMQNERSAYHLGSDLFGAGKLAKVPTDSLKKQIREKLRVKHGYVG